MMWFIKYLYCKSKMSAFLNGELPLQTRRRIARYIDEHPKCYAEYIRQRQLMADIENTLATVGKPTERHLDAVWANIQSELKGGGSSSAFTVSSRRLSPRYVWAVLILIVVLMLPLIASKDTVTDIHEVPSKAIPELVLMNPTSTNTPTTIAMNTLVVTQSHATTSIRLHTLLQNTPEPNMQ